MILSIVFTVLVSVSQGGDYFNADGVYMPYSSIQHGAYGFAAVWLGMSDYVDIELYRNGTYIATLDSWYPSDLYSTTWIYEAPIPVSWGSGSGYYLRIAGSSGREIWSNEFSIFSNSTVRRSSERWATGMTAGVQWSGLGGTVSLSLVNPDGTTTSLGSFSAPSSSASFLIQESMGTGDLFRLKATDSYGNSALSESFSILAVNVTRPSSGETWKRGVSNPTIRWTGDGSEANLTLMKGSQVILDISEGWIANTGEYTETMNIPETWVGGSDYSVRVRIRSSSGEIVNGSSSQFSIPFSDNQIEGARTLTPEIASEGTIDYAGDIDYWSVNYQPYYMYVVDAQCNDRSRLQIQVSGTSESERRNNGEIEWGSTHGGTSFVQVSGSQVPGSEYSVICHMRQFPEVLREIRLAAGASLLQTDGLSGIGAGVDVGAFYSPIRYIECGASLYTTTGDEAFSSIVDPDSTETFVFSSFSAGIESPWVNRFSIRAGISYDIPISGPDHFWMKPEYEDISGAYESGIRGYAGIDCKLVWARYGGALVLRLQRSFLTEDDGRTSIGLVLEE